MTQVSTQDPEAVGEPSPGQREGRYSALDGVRGLAILSVLAFHTDGQWLSGGFLGVDIFFVLSGYLMVGILVNANQSGLSMSMPTFWLRRARRLAPALLTVILVVVLMQVFVLSDRPVQWRGDVLAALAYVTNWWALLSGADYFTQWQAPSPLLQTWSLGIEEQFYLALPLVLWLLLRVGLRGRRLAAVFAALGLASALWAFILQAGEPLRVYFGTDTRVQALLVGAVIGVLCVRPAAVPRAAKSQGAQVAGWLGLAGLVGLLFLIRPWDERLEAWVLTASAVLAGLLLWALLDGSDSPLARAFSWRPLVWVGGISYALYLWHWPVFLWIQSGDDTGLGAQVWSIVLSFVLAWATTRFIETWIRRGSFASKPPHVQWLTYLVAALAVAALTLLPFHRTPAVGPSAPALPATDELPTRLGIFGDSTAYTTLGGFPSEKYGELSISAVTPLGCGIRDRRMQAAGIDPAKPECDGWQQRWRESMKENNPEATMLVESVWEMYDVVIDGRAYPAGSPEYNRVVTDALNEAIDIITPPDGGPVYVLGVPCHSATVPQYVPILNDPARQKALDDLLRKAVASHQNTHYVDLRGLTCGPKGAVNEIDDVRLRFDGVHWTDPGARYFWSEVLPQLKIGTGSQ